jgi:hypothetical protein
VLISILLSNGIGITLTSKPASEFSFLHDDAFSDADLTLACVDCWFVDLNRNGNTFLLFTGGDEEMMKLSSES